MPQQLIYTSAPRGIVAGRSGHCTVARSAAMRDALMLQLERFSYYQHLSLSGGRDRPIFSCRIVDIRGTRFHVLSRIQDAGLDFTGRTNFIAHHLVFTPEEIRQFATPPVILRNWRGWLNSWTGEPELLENENWDELTALMGQTNVPAQTWQQVTSDAVNGYGLLEARAGASFRADDLGDEIILALFSESLELLEIRDPRRDFHGVAWNYTFTTSMQEQDNPTDFRWRCLHSDNPAAARLVTPDCRALAEVRATKLTGEEAAFARTGRLAPRFITEPVNIQIAEGERAGFTAKAEGVPTPTYQWYKCNKDGKDVEPLKGETSPELSLHDPPLGVSRYRVWASNSVNTAQSNLAILSVEKKMKLAPTTAMVPTSPKPPPKPAYVKSAEDIESQRQRLEAETAQETFQKSRLRNKIIGRCLVVALIMGTAMFIYGKIFLNKMPPILTMQPAVQTNADGSVSVVASATGKPSPNYQWYKDDQEIPDATNSSVLLADVNRMNSGAFVVIVTNAAGAVTSTVVQWAGNPPVIAQQPFFKTNQTGTVTINVSAAGGNPLFCQWFRDGQPIPSATSLSLTPFDPGSFSAKIFNKAGAATSATVHWEPVANLILFAPGSAHKTNVSALATQTNSPMGLLK